MEIILIIFHESSKKTFDICTLWSVSNKINGSSLSYKGNLYILIVISESFFQCFNMNNSSNACEKTVDNVGPVSKRRHLLFGIFLKVQSRKLYNKKYMIALTQIIKTEIFAFISEFLSFAYKQKR